MPKRTTQNNTRKRAKTHGWRSRSVTVLTSRRRKGRAKLAL